MNLCARTRYMVGLSRGASNIARSRPPILTRFGDAMSTSSTGATGLSKVSSGRVSTAFQIGTKGMSKAPGSRALAFTLVTVEPDACFASEVKLPGARLRFEHVVEPHEPGSRITHRALLDGAAGIPLHANRAEEHRAGTPRRCRPSRSHGGSGRLTTAAAYERFFALARLPLRFLPSAAGGIRQNRICRVASVTGIIASDESPLPTPVAAADAVHGPKALV